MAIAECAKAILLLICSGSSCMSLTCKKSLWSRAKFIRVIPLGVVSERPLALPPRSDMMNWQAKSLESLAGFGLCVLHLLQVE